jgi:hypothetical protein
MAPNRINLYWELLYYNSFILFPPLVHNFFIKKFVLFFFFLNLQRTSTDGATNRLFTVVLRYLIEKTNHLKITYYNYGTI